MIGIEKLQYSFSGYELEQLALFFRKNTHNFPQSLEGLLEFAENYVYGKMTVEEAEKFFDA
jgi:hypothetical protein